MRTLKYLTLLFIILSVSTHTHAQVTIGTTKEPVSGALLQLKNLENEKTDGSNSTKGLLLPRVVLKKLSGDLAESLNATPGSYGTSGSDGLVVYVPEKVCDAFDFTYPGVHVWTDNKWTKLGKQGDPNEEVFTDGEGNTYTYRRFGTQVWMTQNVRTIYENGNPQKGYIDATNGVQLNPIQVSSSNNTAIIVKTSIPYGTAINKEEVKEESAVRSLTLTYDEIATKFGLLYNQEQAKKACPEGWKLPSNADYIILRNYLGGTSTFGKKAKANNWSYAAYDRANPQAANDWNGYSMCSPNNSGFKALPAGITSGANGGAINSAQVFGRHAAFWLSDFNYRFILLDTSDSVVQGTPSNGQDQTGNHYSVRCIQE